MVEAIDEGRIVRVPEEYAMREGLMILRRPKPPASSGPMVEERPEKRQSGIDALRKPLRYQRNEVVASLVDHFSWVVAQKRREKNITRKQLAAAVQCSEHAIKMIENGILPVENYILINRLESYFGITLRKDGAHYQGSMKELALKTNATSPPVVRAFVPALPLQQQASQPFSETKQIAPAKRVEKEGKPSRWMERRQQREVYEREQARATSLVKNAEDSVTGSDIELFEEDLR